MDDDWGYPDFWKPPNGVVDGTCMCCPVFPGLFGVFFEHAQEVAHVILLELESYSCGAMVQKHRRNLDEL